MLNKILGLFLFLCLSVYAQNKFYKGKVLEVMNSGGYTYVKMQKKQTSFWLAIKQTPVKKGEMLEVRAQMWMKNFKSKSLNKTFDKILFASKQNTNKQKYLTVNNLPSLANTVKKSMPKPSKVKQILVKDLKTKKDILKGKYVSVQGEVIKVSRGIMKSDWVHIKDANEDKIIFRSLKADVKVGDKVKAVGILKTDVDYGYGYAYEIIVLDSTFN